MKVILAQFRKPPAESRFFDRIGASLCTIGYEVISAGAGDILVSQSTDNGVRLTPVFSSSGTAASVWTNLLRLYGLIQMEKPGIMVFSSPEISLLCPLLRILYPGMCLIFDVQENHGLNIQKQRFQVRPRFLYGTAVKILQISGMKFCHRIWMAEKIYLHQFQWFKKKSVLLENLAPSFFKKHPGKNEQPFTLCFTGYISRESGILQAIELIEKIAVSAPDICLLVCGFCPDPELRARIEATRFAISINPLNEWASAGQVMDCILSSAAQLMPYVETEANFGKTPSKWYASLACGKPVWYNPQTNLNLPEKESIGFPVNFEMPDQNLQERWLEYYDSAKSSALASDKWNIDPELLKNELNLIIPRDSG